MKNALCALLALVVFLSSAAQSRQEKKSKGFPEIVYSDELISKFDSLAQAYFDQGLFNGAILVAHEGRVFYEKGFGYADFQWEIPNTVGTVFNLASVSKQFTAVGILILLERGKLELDSPVSIYVPELTNPIFSEITIRQLLTHTSGLPDVPALPEILSDRDIDTREDLIAALNKMDLFFQPGKTYSYSNSGYNILALIIESLTDESYGRFLKKEIFDRAGMSQSCFRDRNEVIKNCAEGYGRYSGKIFLESSENADVCLMGPGNIYSTVEDLLKWDQALYDYKFISKQSTELMFTPHLNDYGFGWAVSPNYYINGETQRVVSHSGRGPGCSTIIYRFLEKQLLVVVLSNIQNSQVVPLADGICGIIADGIVRRPKPSFEANLQSILFADGVDSAKSAYVKARREGTSTMPGPGGINRLAYQYLRGGRAHEALRVFELYMALYPTQSYAYDGYAEALYVNNQRDESIRFYRKAIELNLNNVVAMRMLKYLKVDNPTAITDPLFREVFENGMEAGIRKYRDMQKIHKHPEEAYINTVAYNLMGKGRLDEAALLFELNTRLFPSSSNVWNGFAECQMKMGNDKLAIKYYEKASKLDPDNEEIQKILKELKGKKGGR